MIFLCLCVRYGASERLREIGNVYELSFLYSLFGSETATAAAESNSQRKKKKKHPTYIALNIWNT